MTKITKPAPVVAGKWTRTAGRMLAAGALTWVAAGVIGAGAAGFLGRVAVEWDDTDLFNRNRLVLLTDFGYEDATGRQWIARKGATLDGASFPPLFAQLVGLPFVGEHRRAGILHDYFSQQLTHDWKQVRRMYYEALLAEGLGITEAKTAYAVLYGVGMRWEVKGSSCYVNCHGAATALRWIPDVTEGELEPVFELLNEGNPSLDEIDRAVEAAVPKPGPHLFSQLRTEDNGALGGDAPPDAGAPDADEEDGGTTFEPASEAAEADAAGAADDRDAIEAGAASEAADDADPATAGVDAAEPDLAGPPDPEPAHVTPVDAAPTDSAPTEDSSGEVAPIDATPSDPSPAEVAPIDAAPSGALPAEVAPTQVPPAPSRPSEREPSTAGPSPDGPQPANPLPTDPLPVDPLRTDPLPVDPDPVNPDSVDSIPVAPIPADPFPADPFSADPFSADPFPDDAE